jgi:nitrite reductase/ring-hydroxylating ferredoxin subunit
VAVVAGRELVVWRTDAGDPVVMERFCPHQGAALELGVVVGAALRCPFHHWQFDASGSCVAAPTVRRRPDNARAVVFPSGEVHGYVWTWVGSAVPEYPLPEFPHLGTDAAPHRRYSFRQSTTASPRRVLENGFDVPHFPVVHGIAADLALEWTSWSNEHMLAARLNVDSLDLPAPLGRVLKIERLSLDLRSTPSYQTLTFELNGIPVAHELLTLTPVELGATTLRGWTVMPRSPGLLGTAPAFWAYRLQHWLGTRSDLRIYRDAEETDGSINTADDEGVLRFRQFYRRWSAPGGQPDADQLPREA